MRHGEGRTEEDVEMQDVELQEGHLRPVTGEEEQGEGRTSEEAKRRRRNCVIGWMFVLALVLAIVAFAVFVIEVNKPGRVMG